MSDTTTPAPTVYDVPAEGLNLTVSGNDAAGKPSLDGVAGNSMGIDDPGAVFAFTPAPDGLSATLVPNAGAEGEATVTATAIGANGPLSASYVARVPVGPAVSLTITGEPVVPVAPAA
jgi:hypothetical protein